MPTIAEMNANMTIFYFKSTGNLYTCMTGIVEKAMVFGKNNADLSTIIDCSVFPVDDYMLQNAILFKIDITKDPVILALIPITPINQYPIASS
jgi:hypothetical protein